jgi:Flp pilus assembly protein TadD
MGNWSFHVGKNMQALRAFKRAAKLLPDEAIVYTCQGDIYKAQGRIKLALAAYQKAVRVAPGDKLAHRKLSEWQACCRGTTRVKKVKRRTIG